MENANKLFGFLSGCDRALLLVLRSICVCCFSLLLLLLAGNVFVRYFPVAAFYWFDEVVEWMFAWMVFFGAAALWARNEHFRLEWINEKLKGKPAGSLKIRTAEKGLIMFNIKTAKKIGVEIPFELLETADKIIE